APDFAKAMREHYASEIFREATLETVNSWAHEKTDGKIEKILERLSPNDTHVLLNAIYFNAPWAQAFSKSATRPRHFSLTETDQVDVPTMVQQNEFSVVREDNYAAIRLPYAVDGLSMIVVRPNEIEGLEAVMKDLDGAKVTALVEKLGKTPAKTVSV